MLHEHPHGIIPDFVERTLTDTACDDLLRETRWPDGFECPLCYGKKGYLLKRRRTTYQCANKHCNYQCSVTAQTIFHGANVPLRKWFMCMFLMVGNQSGCSAVAIGKLVGVATDAAAYMTEKLRRVMEDANKRRSMDSNFFGVRTLINLNGRAVAAAVFVQKELSEITDGFEGEDYCKGGNAKKHETKEVYKVFIADPSICSKIDESRKIVPEDPAIELVVRSSLAQLNRFLLGTYHRYCLKKFPLYVAEFVYRFNEPNPAVMFRRLVKDCIMYRHSTEDVDSTEFTGNATSPATSKRSRDEFDY